MAYEYGVTSHRHVCVWVRGKGDGTYVEEVHFEESSDVWPSVPASLPLLSTRRHRKAEAHLRNIPTSGTFQKVLGIAGLRWINLDVQSALIFSQQ